jgi:hypothetical protein
MTTMSFEDLEQVYERLAQAIDQAGPANEAVLLTKLVLLLARRQGDLAGFEESLTAALADLSAQRANVAPR